MNDLRKTLNQIIYLNQDEQFYKDYYEASASHASLKKFLSSVDIEDAIDRHLVIPELLPEIISYEMNDDEYFSENDGRNVFISRHNRYTPAFMHRHDFFEIIFVFTGKCTQTIGLSRKQFKEGDVIFIAPGIYHTMEVFDDDSAVFNILLRKSTFYQMFTPLMKGHDLLSKFFSEGLYNSQQIEYVIFHPGQTDLIELQNQLLELYKEHLFHDAYSDQIMVGLLTRLNAKIMREHHDTMESSYSENDHRSQEHFMVMSYIQEHLTTVTLTDVASHFGFSTSYCSRLIKSSTGQGFNEWKRMLRMRHAEQMLLNTKKSISEISASLGYENPETFIRAFKKELHMTPSKYRKISRKL
ncbi:MAG: AraC family transcriptional regulator [Lachnospiraceae bacterium]|nr:AraC family transcriptional regulator [Lachnospiraceae bacterium]